MHRCLPEHLLDWRVINHDRVMELFDHIAGVTNDGEGQEARQTLEFLYDADQGTGVHAGKMFSDWLADQLRPQKAPEDPSTYRHRLIRIEKLLPGVMGYFRPEPNYTIALVRFPGSKLRRQLVLRPREHLPLFWRLFEAEHVPCTRAWIGRLVARLEEQSKSDHGEEAVVRSGEGADGGAVLSGACRCVAREDELVQAVVVLSAASPRLWITGEEGVGKTLFAEEVIRRCSGGPVIVVRLEQDAEVDEGDIRREIARQLDFVVSPPGQDEADVGGATTTILVDNLPSPDMLHFVDKELPGVRIVATLTDASSDQAGQDQVMPVRPGSVRLGKFSAKDVGGLARAYGVIGPSEEPGPDLVRLVTAPNGCPLTVDLVFRNLDLLGGPAEAIRLIRKSIMRQPRNRMDQALASVVEQVFHAYEDDFHARNILLIGALSETEVFSLRYLAGVASATIMNGNWVFEDQAMFGEFANDALGIWCKTGLVRECRTAEADLETHGLVFYTMHPRVRTAILDVAARAVDESVLLFLWDAMREWWVHTLHVSGREIRDTVEDPKQRTWFDVDARSFDKLFVRNTFEGVDPLGRRHVARAELAWEVDDVAGYYWSPWAEHELRGTTTPTRLCETVSSLCQRLACERPKKREKGVEQWLEYAVGLEGKYFASRRASPEILQKLEEAIPREELALMSKGNDRVFERQVVRLFLDVCRVLAGCGELDDLEKFVIDGICAGICSDSAAINSLRWCFLQSWIEWLLAGEHGTRTQMIDRTIDRIETTVRSHVIPLWGQGEGFQRTTLRAIAARLEQEGLADRAARVLSLVDLMDQRLTE